MSVNQDTVIYEETSNSFWDINGYKATSKRVNDGYSLGGDLVALIRERADIESKYAASLRLWSKKWTDLIGKGPEYGTTEAAWRGLFTEADRLCNLHNSTRDQLLNDVVLKLKNWQKENYQKQKLGGLKQFKEMDDGFARAQKPWQKKYDKVMKSKDEYHKACKNLRTAEINERNQQGDTSISEDQKRKNVLKIKECEEKKDTCLSKYESALQDIKGYNARYMEDMTEVFEKCQAIEERRQDFFKEIMFDIQKCLNLSNNPDYSQIYSDLRSNIANADSQKDLKWWSQTYGKDMGMRWPEFEEYEPHQANISKKKRTGGDDGITLTTIVKKEEPTVPQSYRTSTNEVRGSYIEKSRDESPVHRTSNSRKAGYEPALNPFADDGEDLSESDDHAEPSGNGTENPFPDDDDDYLADDGRPGVPIRALYDYVGTEDDELTFKAGDEFEKLEEEDEQGWCKGRLNGRVGLYPANFCVEV